MSTQPLFLDTTLRFEKTAGQEVRLSEDPARWQQEIAAELYKQVPYIAEFGVNVSLDKVNAERGYGLGIANIDRANVKVIIPIFIRDRMLKPIDIFFANGVAQPLTEDRIRRATFTTAPATLTNRQPQGDQGLTSSLFPPIRASFGLGNEMVVAGGDLSKLAMLKEIAPTISLEVREKLAGIIHDDPALHHALETNPAFAECVGGLFDAPIREKVAEEEAPTPDIVQLTRTRTGYLLKHAALDSYAPTSENVNARDAATAFGPDVSSMKPGDTRTYSTNNAVPSTAGEPAPINSFGKYTCWDAETNKAIAGTVFPLLSYEGAPSGLYLFISSGEGGDRAYTIQDRICGIPAPGTPLQFSHQIVAIEQAPVGDGVPLLMAGDTPLAFIPVEVNRISRTEGVVELHGVGALGTKQVIATVPELMQPKVTKKGVLFPTAGMWIPLTGDAVHLLEESFAADTLADAQGAPNEAEVRNTGHSRYNVSGPPVMDLPEHETKNLKTAEAKFLLVGLGLGEDQVENVLEAADDLGSIKVAGLRTASRPRPRVTKVASHNLDLSALAVSLIKEAAAIDDYDSVDKALSLGFLSEENLETFRSHLPTLDSAVSKLAELLMAARVGMTQVPEAALERSLKSLDKVVTALRGMQV